MIKAGSHRCDINSDSVFETVSAEKAEPKSDIEKYDVIFSNLLLEGYKYSSSLRCVVYDYLRGKITKDEMEERINGNSRRRSL